jgi:hypothetical protein
MSRARRLWIVLSIALGVLSGMVAYKEYRQSFAIFEYPDGVADQAFWTKAKADPQLASCNWNTAIHDAPYDGYAMVTCDTTDPYVPALVWALFPAALMAAFILIVRRAYPPKPM